LMGLRPRLRDIIIDAVENDPGLVLVSNELQQESEQGSADAVVVVAGTAEPNDSAVPLRLLWSFPGISVLMIAMSGDEAVLYQLRLQREPVRDVTASGIVATIRMSAGE
jgi:hypothetical protein